MHIPNRDRFWARVFAFLGRYGHQDSEVLNHMPVTEVVLMMEEVGRIIEQEQEKVRR